MCCEREIEMGILDNVKGLILAVGSSLFIGTSFILKKKWLKRAADSGTHAVLVTPSRWRRRRMQSCERFCCR
ncbi:unnamed protein product [Camellia sinensis]